MKPIVLYDENRERVGETYPRRAKQLLRSGRALWLEEGSTMLLLSATCEALPPTEEETYMTEPIMNNNGLAIEAETLTPSISDDLVMYIAKQNVARKRSLIRHIVAFALVGIIFFVSASYSSPAMRALSDHATVREAVSDNNLGIHTNIAWDFGHIPYSILPYAIGSVLNERNSNVFDLVTIDDVIIMDMIRGSWTGAAAPNTGFLSVANWDQPSGMTSTSYFVVSHFIAGLLCAWALWIVVRSVKVVRGNIKMRPVKIDPIAIEYQRLRGNI